MMVALSFLLAFAGFAALSLSMPKHHRDLFGKPSRRATELTFCIAGWLALAGSLTLSIVVAGVSIGVVQWAAFLTLAALIVALLLTYKDTWWRA